MAAASAIAQTVFQQLGAEDRAIPGGDHFTGQQAGDDFRVGPVLDAGSGAKMPGACRPGFERETVLPGWPETAGTGIR